MGTRVRTHLVRNYTTRKDHTGQLPRSWMKTATKSNNMDNAPMVIGNEGRMIDQTRKITQSLASVKHGEQERILKISLVVKL